MTLRNNRVPILYYVKLCASFQSHQWIQTGVTVRKRPIWVKMSDFFVPCNLENWRMTWKAIGHLFYTTSSFVHHFKAIGEFKLELLSGNARFGSKPAIFFVPLDLEIWRMPLKNNRAPPLCYFKLCASFHCHLWIKYGVTVGKRPIWVKIVIFFIRVNLKFDWRPWKTVGDQVSSLQLIWNLHTHRYGCWSFYKCVSMTWLENRAHGH